VDRAARGDEIGKKLDAPRVVNVKRDKSGRIAGAESTVAG
jgi:hypothetical protein